MLKRLVSVGSSLWLMYNKGLHVSHMQTRDFTQLLNRQFQTKKIHNCSLPEPIKDAENSVNLRKTDFDNNTVEKSSFFRKTFIPHHQYPRKLIKDHLAHPSKGKIFAEASDDWNHLQPLMIKDCISFSYESQSINERGELGQYLNCNVSKAAISNILRIAVIYRAEKAEKYTKLQPNARQKYNFEFNQEPLIRCSIITQKKITGQKSSHRRKQRQRVRIAVIKALEYSLSVDMVGKSLVPVAPMDWCIYILGDFKALSLESTQEVVEELLWKVMSKVKPMKTPWSQLNQKYSEINRLNERLLLDPKGRPIRPVLPPLLDALIKSNSLDAQEKAQRSIAANRKRLRSSELGSDAADMIDCMFNTSEKNLSQTISIAQKQALTSDIIPAEDILQSIQALTDKYQLRNPGKKKSFNKITKQLGGQIRSTKKSSKQRVKRTIFAIVGKILSFLRRVIK